MTAVLRYVAVGLECDSRRAVSFDSTCRGLNLTERTLSRIYVLDSKEGELLGFTFGMQ